MLNMLPARMNISLRKGHQKAVLPPPCWSKTFLLAHVLTINAIGLPAKRANHANRIHLGLVVTMLRLPGMFILSVYPFHIFYCNTSVASRNVVKSTGKQNRPGTPTDWEDSSDGGKLPLARSTYMPTPDR